MSADDYLAGILRREAVDTGPYAPVRGDNIISDDLTASERGKIKEAAGRALQAKDWGESSNDRLVSASPSRGAA